MFQLDLYIYELLQTEQLYIYILFSLFFFSLTIKVLIETRFILGIDLIGYI